MTIRTRLTKLEAKLPQPSPIPAMFAAELNPSQMKNLMAAMNADDQTPEAAALRAQLDEILVYMSDAFLEWIVATWGQAA